MRSGLLLALCVALTGCLAPPEAPPDDDTSPPGDDDTTAGDDDTTEVDADGDGFAAGEDCDDGDGDIHPGAEETCDGWPDDDCDGVLDPLEVDGDGDGYTECVGDCRDDDDAVHPSADETCDGWEDDDCDGVPDPREEDGDGDGASECDGDCDDGDPGASPGALETCDGLDNDCDGFPGWDEVDGDGDGWASCDGDCDDADGGAYPGAAETCDGVDDDCDGDIDDVDDPPVWYLDGDGDGYGDPDHAVAACDAPADHRPIDGDCDDGDGAVHPGATEVCDNGTDDDCDGSGGGCYPEGEISLAEAHAFLAGAGSGDEAGWALAVAGDVDGDGVQDVAVGAPAAGSDGEGRAYAILGPVPPGVTSVGSAWLTLAGDAADEYASYAVAAMDDVDGDGIGDVAVGAPGYGGGGGRVAFLSAGLAGGTATTADVDHALDGTGGHVLGSSVAPAGDVDGDGHDDWIVGAYLDDGAATHAGAAYVVFGPWPGGAHAVGSPDLRIATFTGEAAQDGAGWWVSGAGDVDGDGTADVLVSGDGHNGVGTDSGRGYLVYGPIVEGVHSLAAADVILEGESAYDYAGYPLAAAGDVDGDGYGDVLAGAFAAYGGAPDSGRAYLLYGPLGGGIRSLATADVVFLGEDAGDTADLALAGAGDLNGDGLDDVAIGAERHDVGSADAGTAYLFYGPIPAGTYSLATADATISGVGSSAFAGGALAGGADVTGDGHPDLLVGARGAFSGGARTGGVYVIAGGRI